MDREVRIELVVVVAIAAFTIAVLLMGLAMGEPHNPEVEPELFYLFNRTTRTYSDILQWSAKDGWVSMRVADGVATYRFPEKGWASLYLDDSLVVTSALNLTLDASTVMATKVKFDLGKWTLVDHGETLEVFREYKTNDHLVNESWVFAFRLGTPPKITWTIQDLDKKIQENRTIEWRLKVSSSYLSLKARSKANTTDLKVQLKGLEIDWSDFGNSDLDVEANATTSEYVCHFYPLGNSSDLVIDPTVGFTPTSSSSRSWVVIGCYNTNNPHTVEVLNWELMDWVFVDTTNTLTYPVDTNPYPVDTEVNGYVRFYDMWGRSWPSGSFFTGVSGTYTYLEVELPVCWISVRTSDSIRDHDAFHPWNMTFFGNTVTMDRPVLFPVVVDENNPTNWVVGVPEDAWIQDAGTQTVAHDDLVDRQEYVVFFNVTLKAQPTDMWLRMYDNTTGRGVPWETFLVYVDGVLTPTDIVPGWTNESYNVTVKDFFDNTLYTNTSSPTGVPLHLWRIPLPIYSLKLFNQDPDYVHKMAVRWQNSGQPYEFYLAPAEVHELLLYGGTYGINWTPYRWYVAQTTQTFVLSVTAAQYFLVNGTTISRLVSDVAGVYSLQRVITNWVTPDTLWELENAPRCPTYADSDMRVEYIHPYAITRATVTYTLADASSGVLWLPYPDRAGRTYDILEDRLYVAGPYDMSLVINWTGNATEASNTTYNPGVVDLADGGNYTFWSNRTCTLTRVVTWREFELFYWVYRVANRRYQKTLWMNNTMNLTYTDVRWFVAFAEGSTIDVDGVVVEDLNNGVRLVRGENYDVSVGGVSMSFTRVNASTVQSYRLTAWDANASETLAAPTIACTGKSVDTYEGRGYYYVSGSWTNDYAMPYSGTVYISIKVKGEIDPASVIVYDTASSGEVSPDNFAVAGNTVILDADAVGSVSVGSALEYRVYFNERTDDARFTFFSPLVSFGAFAISLYWVSFAVVMVGAVKLSSGMKADDRKALVAVVFVLFFLMGMFHGQGVW